MIEDLMNYQHPIRQLLRRCIVTLALPLLLVGCATAAPETPPTPPALVEAPAATVTPETSEPPATTAIVLPTPTDTPASSTAEEPAPTVAPSTEEPASTVAPVIWSTVASIDGDYYTLGNPAAPIRLVDYSDFL
jgi:outer membrane biosynthesis protein TonB